MKKTKLTESQTIKILPAQEACFSVSDSCREEGISQGTFYNGKNSGMEASQLHRTDVANKV